MSELLERVFGFGDGLDGRKSLLAMLAMLFALVIDAFRDTFLAFPEFDFLSIAAEYLDYVLVAVQYVAAGIGSLMAVVGPLDKVRKALGLKG